MLEIKLLVDEIDYSGISDLVIPILKEKLAEDGKGLSGFVGKHIPAAALNGAMHAFLKFLSPEQKEDLAVSLIAKYEEKLREALQKGAEDRGIGIKVNALSVAKVEKEKEDQKSGT